MDTMNKKKIYKTIEKVWNFIGIDTLFNTGRAIKDVVIFAMVIFFMIDNVLLEVLTRDLLHREIVIFGIVSGIALVSIYLAKKYLNIFFTLMEKEKTKDE